MKTVKFAVSDDRHLIRRFVHWSAYLLGSGLCVIIRPNREVTASHDLLSEERAELYTLAIPAIEKIIEDAMRDMGVSEVDVIQQWEKKEMRLWTPAIKPDMRARHVYDAYRRVINAAA